MTKLISMWAVPVLGYKVGNFGACLMAQPKIVAEAVAAMQTAVTLPITVKASDWC